MELDLDAFLDSHNTSDDDEEEDQSIHRHRTVDEILLNDSDSSSSPSSPSSLNLDYLRPQLFSSSNDHPETKNDIFVNSPKNISAHETTSVDNAQTLRLSNDNKLVDPTLVSSSRSTDIPGDSFPLSSNTLRPLPPVFGGVRSNTKPGAALAAAAAASRSITTPHAAAIKLRRARTSALLKDLIPKSPATSDIEDLGVPTDASSGCGSETSSTHKNYIQDDENLDTFQASQLQVNVESFLSTGHGVSESSSEKSPVIESPKEVADASIVPELRLDDKLEEHPSNAEPETYTIHSSGIEQGPNLDNSYANVDSNDGSHDHQIHSFLNDNVSSKPVATIESIYVDEGRKFEESSTSEVRDDVTPESKENDESDITELVEDISFQWKSKMDGKKTVKKTHVCLKPLELAEELEKKHSFTGLHWEEGAAAQPMRLEGVRRGSTVLGYFDIEANNSVTRSISSQPFKKEHGSPQVIAVHLNYIALGMSKGVIVVVPSKYSPHHPDKMDAKMLMLVHGERPISSVTSMCFNQQGELLFAGYEDGHYTIWDVQRVSAVKVINEHKAPVIHMLYLGQDSQVTRQFNVVSGDSKGVVKLIKFSVVPWVNRYTASKPMTLLDETTSTVVCASQLLPEESSGSSVAPSQGNGSGSNSGIGGMMGGVVGGDWKLFEGSSVTEEGVVIFVTHSAALVAKVNPNVEVYAQLPKPDGVREGSMPYTAWKYTAQSHASTSTETIPDKVPLLAIAWDRKVEVAKLVKSELKIYGKWTLESSAIGVAWLDDQMLVVLTVTGQLTLFAKDGTVIHQTSFMIDGRGGDDLIGYHTHFNNIYGNPEKAYHNCVAVRGATIYILGPTQLVVSRLLPWKERIEVLRKAGDWMGALNMAITLYDGQSHGVIDLPRSSLDDVQKAVMPYLVELLLSYVDEVFSYMSVIGKTDDDEAQAEIKEQYTRVGGVAVEFCVHIKRTDLLFEEILSRFVSVEHRDTYLELLEPYILKDMLGSLPPEIMQALVEHYSMKGWLQRVEQCVLHMDISSLDFNQVVRLCREHRLYGALIYLFNKGLDDYRAPLEDLLVVLRNSQRENAPAVGYRMLVYLKYCFSGLAFPPGHGSIPRSRLPSLRTELIEFVLEYSDSPNSWALLSPTLSSTPSFPNLFHLLQLDTEATLHVLRCAFTRQDDDDDDDDDGDSLSQKTNLVQKLVNALSLILGEEDAAMSDDDRLKDSWPSKDDIGHVFDFIAYYVSLGMANVSKAILSHILEYLTTMSEIDLQNNDFSKKREKQVLALLEIVPEADWDASYLLNLCEKAHFYQVCGLIHSIRHHNVAALESYMKDVNEPIHAFAFIDYKMHQSGIQNDDLHSSILSRIKDLVILSRECTFFLVVKHLSQEHQHFLSELHAHPESRFLYLKTIIEVHSTGTLNFSCINVDSASGGLMPKAQSDRVQAYLERISDFSKFLKNNPVHVTDEMIEQYLELLCKYERGSVLKFLETFESYRVEQCLQLCQKNGIIDAAAFLLERVGDVATALSLTLSGLNLKFIMLDAAVQAVLLSHPKADHFQTVMKKKEVNDIVDIVRACIQLCQRNSPRLNPEESESLWFQLLDSFCEPLIDDIGRENKMGTAADISWKVSISKKGGDIILKKLFSVFIKEIVEGMIGYVRLPTIMLKLLSDNGSQEFGDFKITILGMLGTYDFERRILNTAKSLIEDDTFYTMSLLKKGASHGYGGPKSLQCCICNCLLYKNSSSTSSNSSIRVFNCGHATHIQCEIPEKGFSGGCPVCMPKKNGSRSKTKSDNNGLVVSTKSYSKSAPGNVVVHHPHETDAFENPYSSHPISRFEILRNLKKEERMGQIENIPELRLAPPAVYHEKVKKGVGGLLSRGAQTSSSSSNSVPLKTVKNNRQLRDSKAKGSAIRFPLRSNIFGTNFKGKEKPIKR
jgi:hypothetical protein